MLDPTSKYPLSHALDRAVAGVRVDRRPGEQHAFTLSGKRAATIAEDHPPWHSPTRLTRPPRSSMATISSSR